MFVDTLPSHIFIECHISTAGQFLFTGAKYRKPVLALQCLCRQSVLHEDMVPQFPFGMKWHVNCSPDLLT